MNKYIVCHPDPSLLSLGAKHFSFPYNNVSASPPYRHTDFFYNILYIIKQLFHYFHCILQIFTPATQVVGAFRSNRGKKVSPICVHYGKSHLRPGSLRGRAWDRLRGRDGIYISIKIRVSRRRRDGRCPCSCRRWTGSGPGRRGSGPGRPGRGSGRGHFPRRHSTRPYSRPG